MKEIKNTKNTEAVEALNILDGKLIIANITNEYDIHSEINQLIEKYKDLDNSSYIHLILPYSLYSDVDIKEDISNTFSKHNINVILASGESFYTNSHTVENQNNIVSLNNNPLFVAREFPDAQLPTKNHEEDAGWDVYAYQDTLIPANSYGRVPTGIRIMVGKGFRWHFAPRSGLGYVKLIQAYYGSIMDSYFSGDTTALVFNHSNEDYIIKKGDRFCQIIITQVPEFQLQEVSMEELSILSEGKRGEKKWGSSGK